MKNFITILLMQLAMVVITTGNSSSQVLDWAKSYSPADNSAQHPNGGVVDADGNLYIVGSTSKGISQSDIVLVKYNVTGQYVWGRTYDGSSTGTYSNDFGKAIALYTNADSIFVYCVGFLAHENRLLIIKYDKNGNEKWQKKTIASPGGYVYTDPVAYSDESGNLYIAGGNGQKGIIFKYNNGGTLLYNTIATHPAGFTISKWQDMAVDASGNVYVTGDADSGSYKYSFTGKYNAAGTQQWTKTFGSAVNPAQTKSIAITATGYAYVTGEELAAGNYNMILIKRSLSSGDTLWTKKFSNTATSQDYSNHVAVDEFENIFISGPTDYDVATVKCNSTGTQQWAKIYAGPGGYSDNVGDIMVDQDNNLVLGISSDISYSGVSVILKYNSSGTVIWNKAHNLAATDFEQTIDILPGQSGNVYSIVSSGYGNISDFGIIKYNIAGTFQWTKKFYGAELIYDVSSAVTTDLNGNVIAAGKVRMTSSGDDLCIVKYNSAGVFKWVYTRGGGLYDISDAAIALTTDAQGNIYYTGTVHSDGTSGLNLYVGKLDSSGSVVWFTAITGNFVDTYGSFIKLDNSGNIIVGSKNVNASGGIFATVSKFNSAGVHQWSQHSYGHAGGDMVPNGIAVDPSGNVFLTGVRDSTAGTDVYTIKYSSAGALQWTNRYNGSANADDGANDIFIDKGGNVYVAGYIKATGLNEACVFIKYNNSGVQRWVRTRDVVPGTNAETFISISSDTSMTKFYVAGFNLTTGFINTDYTLDKYDSAGVHQWQNVYNNPSAFYDMPMSIVVDKSENSYITGNTSSLSNDMLTISVDKNGVHRWAKTYTNYTNRNDEIYGNRAIAVDNSGNVFITGTSYDTLYGNQMTIVKYKPGSATVILSLTGFIEGFYNSTTNSMVADTIRVILRNSAAPYSIVDSAKAVLNSSGTASLNFNTAVNGVNYYVVMKHRNSVETWSKNPAAFSAGTLAYNFSTAATTAYGDNQKSIDASPVRFGIFSGDVNQDGFVNGTDLNSTFNNSSMFASGYLSTDINGDNVTNFADIVIVNNNSIMFVGKETP